MDCAHYECHRLWAQLVAKTRRNLHVLCHDLVIDRHRTDYSSPNIHPNCMNLHRIIPLIILYRMRLFSWKSTIYSKRYSLLSVAISNRHGQFFRRRAKIQNLPCKLAGLACKIFDLVIAPYEIYQRLREYLPASGRLDDHMRREHWIIESVRDMIRSGYKENLSWAYGTWSVKRTLLAWSLSTRDAGVLTADKPSKVSTTRILMHQLSPGQLFDSCLHLR